MVAILRYSVVVVVRTRPQAIPLAMITKTKSLHGFPLISHDAYGASHMALRAGKLHYNVPYTHISVYAHHPTILCYHPPQILHIPKYK